MDGDNEVDLVAFSDDGNAYIMLNVIPVTVVSMTPTNNSLDVSPTADIVVVFDRDMTGASLTASTVRVEGSRSGITAGTYGYNSGTKTLTISGLDFMPGEVVSVVVTGQATSTVGAGLNPFVSTYTVTATGNGYFSFNDILNTSSQGNHQLLTADVDGDGDDDLIGFASNVLNVYTNDAGTFSAFSTFALGSEYPDGGIVGDFDNDGDPDVLIWSFNTTGSLLENDGLGNFTRNTTFDFSNSGQKSVTVADFDGDGNLDLAYNFGNGILNVNYGAGDFTFPEASYTNLDFNGNYMYPRKLVAGDFNHDGRMDVAGFNNQRDMVFVMMNNGNRSFSPSEVYTVPASTYDIAVANLTGSAHPDLVLASQDNRSFTLLTSDGDGTFSNMVTYGPLPYKLNRVSAFDFSGNGKPDLVFHAEDAVEENDLLFMAYNDGNGGFGNQVTFSIPNEEPEWYYGLSSWFTVLDANNDGALDIASRLTDGSTQYIAFIENATPSGGGSTPTTAVTNASASNIAFNKATLNWTNGNGLRRLIVMKQGAPVDATLVDDSGYGPNPTFGNGTQLGSGNYFVYGGNGSSTLISGLDAETTYHYAIFEINGIPGEEKILTTGAPTGSFTTTTAPPVFRISEGYYAFTKVNNADWTLEVNQDRINDYVWLTRKGNNGLFNARTQPGYDEDGGGRIQWAYGSIDNIESLTFKPFKDAVSDWGDLEDVNDDGPVPLVLYLDDINTYIELSLTQWTRGNNGGGFSYIRADGDFPEIPTLDFDAEPGQALSFDGTNQFAQFSTYNNETEDNYDFANPLTLEMWVKPSSLPSTGEFELVMSSRSRTLYIGINEDHKFFTSIRPNPSDYFEAIGTTTVETGKWYHVSVSVKGNGELRLYVNAELEASDEVTSSFVLSTDWINLGGGYTYPTIDYGHFFHGQMDEFRIWNSERTASQIRGEMFTAPLSANPITAALAWQMNEGTGNSVVDLINGFNLDLTADGASTPPSWVASTIPFGAETLTATGVQSGIANVGGATFTFNTPFENPVDVFFNEITTAPNVFPAGFTASLGGKYFVIDLVGNPGTFSLNLSLTFGPGVVTEALESTPSLLKLYRRSSGSGGAWTEIASASSAVASTGVVTWPNITSFSEFIAIEAEPEPILGIASLDVTTYFESDYTFNVGNFAISEEYEDAMFSIKLQSALSGGTLFVDLNDNGVADEGTDRIVNATTGVNFTPSDLENRLRFLADGYGVLTASIIFALGEEADTLAVTFTTVESTPTLAGQANQAGWYLMSNPLDTPLSTLFSTIWTQGAENSNAPSGQANLFTFNPATSAYAAVTNDLTTTTMSTGQGVLAYVFAFDDYAAGVPEGGGWPKTLTNEGNPFTSSAASVNVLNVDTYMPEGTSGSEGFNLFGNPYAWPMSADSLIATLKRADPLANSYVYRWNQPYQTWQLVTSGAIQPYESVFIRAITTGLSANLEFSYDDRFVMDVNKVQAEPLFALTLTHPESGLTSSMSLRSDEKGSVGIDPFDGYYMGSYSRTFANLFTQVDDQSLVIHNLPSDLDREVVIPMYLHASVAGEFDLSWDANSIPEGWSYTIEDVATGKMTDLTTSGSYRFTVDRLSKSAADESGVFALAASDEPVLLIRARGPATPTSVEDLATLPMEVELGQNYPNPFNPSTQIRYGVPTQSQVRLEVFDMLGRQVAVLVNGQMQAGRHTVSFDASRLASGVYVYRLAVGSKVMTKRMVLIK